MFIYFFLLQGSFIFYVRQNGSLWARIASSDKAPSFPSSHPGHPFVSPPITSASFPDHELSFSHFSAICKSAYCWFFSAIYICLCLSYILIKFGLLPSRGHIGSAARLLLSLTGAARYRHVPLTDQQCGCTPLSWLTHRFHLLFCSVFLSLFQSMFPGTSCTLVPLSPSSSPCA